MEASMVMEEILQAMLLQVHESRSEACPDPVRHSASPSSSVAQRKLCPCLSTSTRIFVAARALSDCAWSRLSSKLHFLI
eukprot:3396136-Amphidinium_carterae.1